MNRIEWMQNEYRLTGDDVVLQKTPTASTCPSGVLLAAALRRPSSRSPPPADTATRPTCSPAVRAFGVTTLHFVPSMLRSIVEADTPPHKTDFLIFNTP
ncbi:hypothetical protein LV779_14870, partial [Streptomyces thinghirensis]|nr:hypothetical protein [Streptomyces thinghirensis]